MFYVINMVGSTFDITINDGTKDTTLSAGEGQAFFYDGSAWETVQDGAIWVDSGTDLSPFNDRHITPKTDNNRSLGSIVKRWLNGYFSGKVSIGNTGAEPNATLEVLGSEAHQTTRTAIALVLSSTDKYHTVIFTNAVGITQALPAGAANVLNKEYEFVNRGTSTVSITDSAGTLIIVINPGESITFQWDGTEWIAK
jgi:hypothetical protein